MTIEITDNQIAKMYDSFGQAKLIEFSIGVKDAIWLAVSHCKSNITTYKNEIKGK